VQAQIDTVKDVMIENIDRVLERGERIELLVDKTDRLNQQAFKFEKSVSIVR
jgi:vesicle-associated membrane protein 7